MTDDYTGCDCGECDWCVEQKAGQVWDAVEKVKQDEAYEARKAAYLERIRIASGAAELKEYGPKKTRKRRAPGAPLSCGCRPENDEIRDLVRWDNRTGSRFDLWWTRAEDNEQRRKDVNDPSGQRRRGWLRDHGADNPGFPDFLCRGVAGLLIEMKAKCHRHVLTPAQKVKIPELRAAGYTVLICHGADDAIAQLDKLPSPAVQT